MIPLDREEEERRTVYTGGMSSSNRLWVGPLLLVLVIALIYIFSLMPNGPAHRDMSQSAEEAYQSRFGQSEREFELHRRLELEHARDLQMSQELLLESSSECLNGGFFNDTSDSCVCASGFIGTRCETPLRKTCLNNGFYAIKLRRCHCRIPWTGDNCQFKCSGGHINATTGNCDCVNRFFGPGCELACIHGVVVDGMCRCNSGFVGISCATCDPALVSSGECDLSPKRRGSVNSRLTLSGLSFCMITIGLLCITARRRRNGMVPPADDTWYRVFHSTPARHSRCRHEFVCGGSWVPRDRALIVSPGRAALTHGRASGSSRSSSRRAATPPPSYTSVDNLNEEQSPPTYEEATQVPDEVRVELIDETGEAVVAKDEVEVTATTPTSAAPATTVEEQNRTDRNGNSEEQ